ncbi:putative NAD(P)-binding-domain-containing protein [Dioszegia hungarica]|uniref:precorrin-2 dehydrogenase n=1 Tax=Dioszegia hungarica TaxID=4972 RepID=A0AA38LTH4_9TREE|nr:putative NAD(P)-binding-domain-containing protein [Dioszegia hungarica]KAI9636867.1 putative NAD(P)-binding-domain-containing protein [Dioszegia hungarica]
MGIAEAAPPPEEYPPIVKGASLLIAYQLKNRRVLLIGGGVVASGRLFFLLESGAHVTIVAPSPLEPSIAHRLTTNADDITWHDRDYTGRSDPIIVDDFVMVLTAIDNNPLSREVCYMAREKHIPVNVADVPPECDFYFGAQLRRGPLQVMVSTQGQGPKIGAMVRDRVIAALPENVEEAIAGVGELRGELRKRAPGVGGELGQQRMAWMIGMCDSWSLDLMGDFRSEALRNRVLEEGWEKGKKVVGPNDVGQCPSLWAERVIGEYCSRLGGWATVCGFLGGITVGYS